MVRRSTIIKVFLPQHQIMGERNALFKFLKSIILKFSKMEPQSLTRAVQRVNHSKMFQLLIIQTCLNKPTNLIQNKIVLF